MIFTKKIFVSLIALGLILPGCNNSSSTPEHTWGSSTYIWATDYSSCTAERKCLDDETLIEKETASSLRTVIIEPTCEEAGRGMYSASFINKAFETQIHYFLIDPTEHDYKFDSFVWDGYTAKAKCICSKDVTHIKYFDVEMTSEITVTPTCESSGKKVYTATYNGHSDTKEEILSPTNHDYKFDSFVWEGYTAKAKYVCNDNASHIVYYDASISSEITTNPACLTTGIKTYTASYDGHSDTKEEVLEALGHDIIQVEAKEATCDEEGHNAYEYCSRCDYSTYEVVEPLGHHFVKDEDTLFYECDHEGCEAYDGRDYEMTIKIDPLYVGDLYNDRDYTYSFKNDDYNLDLGFVTFTTEDNTSISPEDVGDNYHISNSLVGQKVTAHIYIVVIDDQYAKFNEGILSNCDVFVNGDEVEIDSYITSDLYDGYSRTCYHASYELGEIQPPYNGQTPRVDRENGTILYGLYPQSYISDSTLISHLNEVSEPESNGWYLYDGFYYAKAVANPYSSDVCFNDGTSIVEDDICWFKCEPIEWKPLTNNDGNYFLVTTKILDRHSYHSSTASRIIDDKTIYSSNYEYSDVRAYLNGNFYNSAFALGSDALQITEVDNSKEATDSGSIDFVCNNTNDYVFLLTSLDYYNSSYGFSNDRSRYAKTTDYARAVGCLSYLAKDAKLANGIYLTRSPSTYSYTIDVISTDGGLWSHHTNNYGDAIRPAITIRLD